MTEEEYTIAQVDKPEWETIGTNLSAYNKQQAGGGQAQNLCFVIKSPDGKTVGGVIGDMHWDWLHVDLLWITDELRGHGYGHRLLTLIEEEARRRGAKNAYLDTFSFQAPDFYKQHGYRVFGELPDFPAGHTRYFFVKQL